MATKTIGICITNTIETGVVCHQETARHGIAYFTPIITRTPWFEMINSALTLNDSDFLVPLLADSVNRNAHPGAEIAIIPAYTGHIVFDKIEAKASTQLLSILDIDVDQPRVKPLYMHQSTSLMLLEQGANVNACEKFSDVLQAAGHLSITSLLMQHNADVNNPGGYYGTALQAAAFCGHCDVAKALIEAGSYMGRPGSFRDAFHAAAEG